MAVAMRGVGFPRHTEWSRFVADGPSEVDAWIQPAFHAFTGSRQLLTGNDMMKWEAPTATDLRFGFEITMYIANR